MTSGAQVAVHLGEGDEDLTVQGGLGVIGRVLAGLPLGERLNQSTVPGAENYAISHRNVVVGYIGLLAQGKDDFDPIKAFRDPPSSRSPSALSPLRPGVP